MSDLLYYDFGGGGGGGTSGQLPTRPLTGGAGGVFGEITVKLLDFTLADVADLELTRNWRWRDELSECGTGEIFMLLDDPAAGDMVLNGDDVIQFLLDGDPVFAFLVEEYDQKTIDPREESEQGTKWGGRGLLSVLDRAQVYPSLGLGRQPIQEDRVFNYTLPEFDDSDWVAATEVYDIANAQVNWPVPWAADFPDLDAFILWTSDGTTTDADSDMPRYFRQRFTLADPVDGAILFVTMDNMGTAYIDGVPIAGVETNQGFTRTTQKSVDLSAGEHVFAAEVINIPQALSNPAGLAWALYIPGYPPTLLADSNGTDCVVIAAPQPPGMTPGEVAVLLLDEAHARDELMGVALTFDGDVDSDGNAWPTNPKPTISTKVGTDYLTFFREIAGTYWDMWMPPDSFNFYAWRYNEMTEDRTADSVFTPPTDPDDPSSGNLTLANHKGQLRRVDRALIRWLGGWSSEEWSPVPDDVVSSLLGLGAIDNRAEVTRVGQGQLAVFGHPREAIQVGIFPNSTDTTPYAGFQIGDTVTAPLRDLTPDTVRVMAITASVNNATGIITWVPELLDVLLQAEQQFQQAIKKMTNGTFGGRSKVAQPVVPVFVPRPRIAGEPATGGCS